MCMIHVLGRPSKALKICAEKTGHCANHISEIEWIADSWHSSFTARASHDFRKSNGSTSDTDPYNA